jgi:hypothetical protein
MRWSALLASASLLALFIPGDSEAQWGGGYLPKTHLGSGGPPPTTCPRGSAFADGCAAAPAAPIPLATSLNTYAVRPPWNVAGVDYGVGVPTGTSLQDVRSASLPTGCTYASPTVTCASGTPTLNAMDFSLGNGTRLRVTGGSVTVTNSKFVLGSNSAAFNHNAVTASGNANLTFRSNEFDGAHVVMVAQQDSMVQLNNSGTSTFEYNRFHAVGGDVVDAQSGTRVDDFRYNVFDDNGMDTNNPGDPTNLGHSDTIQHDMGAGSALNSADWGFNTVYTAYNTTEQEGGLGLLAYQNGPGANGHNVSLHNNTLMNKQVGVCTGGPDYSGNFVAGYVEASSSGDTNGRLANNYIDATGSDCFTGVWLFPNGFYGGDNGYLAQPMAMTGNVNMVAGVQYTDWPTFSPPGYFTVPDAAGYTASISDLWVPSTISPTSGNVVTGSNIDITVHLDAAYTVTGSPRLTLNSGGNATYLSGSGTNDLVFRNTVATGNAANPLAVTGFSLNGGTIKDPFGNAAILTTSGGLRFSIVQSFPGVTVNSGTPTIALNSVPLSGTVGTPAAFTFAYTVSAPTGMSCVWNSGAVPGGTVTGFSASGGTGGGSCPAPAAAGTYTLHVAGTGPNTAAADAGNTTTFAPSGGTACAQGSAFADGCPGAPTGTAQFPNILSSYAARPPWNVAGVDFHVGVPTGTSLTSAATATMPTGCSRSTGVITCASGSPTLNALDFTGVQLVQTGGNLTVTNSSFTITTQPGAEAIVTSGSGSLTLTNDTIDGANVAGTDQVTALIFLENPTFTGKYLWIRNVAGDVFNLQAGPRTDTLLYSFVENFGTNGGHVDYLQWDGAISSANIGFDVSYQTVAQSGPGLGGLTLQNNGPGQANNMSLYNSVIIQSCSGCGNFATGYAGGNNPGGTIDTNGRIKNLWIDPTGSMDFTGQWMFPDGFYGPGNSFAQPMAIADVTNMVTGTKYANNLATLSGYNVAPDANGFTPKQSDLWLATTASPSSGTRVIGDTVVLTLHMDEAWAVTGAPFLTTNAGGNATFTSGSGTNSLVFTYTVASGNSAANFAITGLTLNGGTIKDAVGNTANTSTVAQTFAGLTISGSAGNSLAFTALNGGSTSSTTAISGTYGGSAPSGLTNASFGNGCTGSPTITGFSASGGTWNATTTTPATACTGTETVTGTGANVVTTLPSPSATFSTGGGGGSNCPQGTADPNDGCSGAALTGSIQHSNFFTGYTTQSYAHRPAWNVAGVDYPVGYSGTLTSAATATLPACATRSGSTITINSAPCNINHLDFSVGNSWCLVDNAAGSNTVTIENNKFNNGSGCNANGGALLTLTGSAPVIVQYNQFNGNQVGGGGLLQALMQNNAAVSSITVQYNAFIDTDQADIQLNSPTTLNVHYNYAEGLACCTNHGDWVIPNWSGTGAYNDSYDTVYSGGTRSSATTACYVTAQNGAGTISGSCKNMVLVANGGGPQGAISFLFESDAVVVNTFVVTNNWLDASEAFGYYTDQSGSTFNGPITCSGNKDLITGATAAGTFLGRTCN